MPLSTADTTCPECHSHPPLFTEARIPFLYRPPTDQLIKAFKDHGDLAAGRALIEQLVQYLTSQPLDSLPDAVCAVPSHWRRRLHRGLTPSEMIARAVAKSIKRPYRSLVRATRHLPDQRQLDRTTRQKNLASAFAVSHKLNTNIKHVVLVDDVVTTTATARKVSELLRQAGIERITLVALARTPKH